MDSAALTRSIHLQRVASVRLETGPTRARPFCAETIQQAAKVCRSCQRDLP